MISRLMSLSVNRFSSDNFHIIDAELITYNVQILLFDYRNRSPILSLHIRRYAYPTQKSTFGKLA